MTRVKGASQDSGTSGGLVAVIGGGVRRENEMGQVDKYDILDLCLSVSMAFIGRLDKKSLTLGQRRGVFHNPLVRGW